MKAKKNVIVHLITALDIGGTEMMLLKTLPNLNDYNHIVCSLTSKGEIGARLEARGIRVLALNSTKPFSLQTYRNVRNVLLNEKPQILQTYLAHADLLGRFAGRRAKVPIIICSMRSRLNDLKFVPIVAADILTSWMVDGYLANSNTTANWFARLGIRRGKIKVIYNGLNFDDMKPTVDRHTLRRSVGIADNQIVISCVAKLRDGKGHKYLIEAMSGLSKAYPNLVLLLVGGGELENALRTLTKKLSLENYVRFLGNRKDIADILHASDVFVFPTLYEGMSNALMEAMAVGLPIITTDIPENRELIVHNECGILVPSKNTLKLSEAVKYFATHQEEAMRMGQNARKRATQYFSIDNTLEQLKNFYTKLCTA